MTRLVSGRILKTPSANVSAERYQFLEISEAEPDLGVPPANNYIFTSDPEGNRQWVDLRTTLANEDFSVGNIIVADTIFGNGLIVQNINILDAIIGITTLANNIVTVTVLADSITSNTWNNLYTANVIESDENLFYTNDRVFSNIQLASVGDLNDVTIANIEQGQALVWNGNLFVPVFVNSEVANVADLAVRVLSIENFTTANIREASSNLYFTNSRVLDALVEANVIVNDLFVSGDLVVQGNSAVLNVSTLIVEDKNIVIANGAASASIADGAGITIEGANATILYKESGDKFELNKNLDVLGNITAGVGTGGSITGANIIDTESLTTDLVSTNLLLTDSITSNTIINSDSITAETIFANVVANIISTDSIGATSLDSNAITSNLLTVSGSMVGNLTGQVSDITNHSVNSLVDVDITGILTGQIIAWDGAKFIPGSADVALFSERSNSAVVANTVLSLEGLTTDDLAEGANLYFSNARARQAFSAGRGIIIQENGVIKSVDDSDLYNLDLNGSIILDVTDVMAPILAIPTTPVNASYVVQSLHITNISEETAHLSANVVFASNSTVTLFDKLALPVGSSLELFDKSLALRPGDTLNTQSFNQSEVATSNVIAAFLVYESVFEDISFVNAGIDLVDPDSNILLYDSNLSYTILESIKISNLEDVDVPVRVYITDANTNIKGYLTHKLPVPSNSVVDILKKPKRLERNDRLYINYTGVANTNAVSAFMSGRIGAYYILDVNPGEIAPGTDSVVGFETTAAEGTQLYYTIRSA
jgi:hypothetical protein